MMRRDSIISAPTDYSDSAFADSDGWSMEALHGGDGSSNDTLLATAPFRGKDGKDDQIFCPLCIYWGVGDEEIVLQAKELRELVQKWKPRPVTRPTYDSPHHKDDPHEAEKFANAFYSLCWTTKFGAPYPLAWVRRMQGRVCHPDWIRLLDEKTQSPIFEKSGLPDAGGAGGGGGSFRERNRKFQDWLLLCDADSGEGVDIGTDQIWRMATSGDQGASPSLRLVVNLPANALRFTMEVAGCGIPWVSARSLTRWRCTSNFRTFDWDPNEINHMHALMDAVVVVRDGVAAVTGFLDCGFVEQIADEVLADADCESTKGAMGFLVDVLLKSSSRCYDDQRSGGLFCRDHGTPTLQVWDAPSPAYVKEWQQLFSCASDEIELLLEEMEGMLVRLAKLGFVAHCRDPETRRRAALRGAVDCGFKALGRELLKPVGTRRC